MARPRKKQGFEESLKELEAIVGKLEGGSLPLEESLDLFERGVVMSRELQGALAAATLRVTRLIEGDPPKEVPFGGDVRAAGSEEPREP